TPYFRPALRGLEFKAHAIPFREPPAPPAAKRAAPEPSEPTGAALLDTPVGATRRVNDLFELIKSFGFDAYIVGGAVRDALMGNEPKDVDLKTNMPLSRLEQALRED